jgi:hypothetical protein
MLHPQNKSLMVTDNLDNEADPTEASGL